MSQYWQQDYMYHQFFMHCQQQNVRPGFFYNTPQKRQYQHFMEQEEMYAKRPRNYHEQEQELRERGLNTAIPRDNVGFKLLEKMGFVSGNGLGKSDAGITEPIPMNNYNNYTNYTYPVAAEEYDQNMYEEYQEQTNVYQKPVLRYIPFNAEKRIFVALQRDYDKAQHVCEELDFRTEVVEPELPHFWTELTRSILRETSGFRSYDENGMEISEDDDEYEVNNFTLKQIIVYIRNQYSYCIYCGDFVDDDEEYCPGYYREDHED